MSENDGKSKDNLHIESVLVAEFDIDVGSSLNFQWPFSYIKSNIFQPAMTENSFAELMLPDGAHLRDEDWTYSILRPGSSIRAPIEVDVSKQCKVKRNQEDEKEMTVLMGEKSCLDFYIGNSRNQKLFSFVLDVDVRAKSENEKNLEISNAIDKITIKPVSENDNIQFLISNVKAVLEKGDSGDQENNNTETSHDLIYVINLVRTKHIPGVKRGARVKAMSILSKYPFCHVFKPLLILALEKFFLTPSLETLEYLYNSINTMDMSTLPQLSLSDKLILRGGNSMILFPDEKDPNLTTLTRYLSKSSVGIGANNSRPRGFETKLVYDGIQHVWETKVDFDGIPVPIKIPLDSYPGEIADVILDFIPLFSVTHFLQTFHTSNLKPSEPSGFMVILHSLLSQKRVLFLGYQLPAGQVAKHVLAACSLFAPLLQGFINRAFPYACLTNLDQLLNCPGYIAGVTNPTFQTHDQWWDVLCDVPTGKVTLSPKMNAVSAYGWSNSNGTSSNEDEKEKDLIAKDLEFMNEIMRMMEARQNEMRIRQKISNYVKRFVSIAAAYEVEPSVKKPASKLLKSKSSTRSRSNTAREPSPLGSSNGAISIGSISTVDSVSSGIHVASIGPKAVFGDDEVQKRIEILMYSKRVESWKGTISYKIYQQQWQRAQVKRVAAARFFNLNANRDRSALLKETSQTQIRPRFTSLVETKTSETKSSEEYMNFIAEELDPASIVEKFKKCRNLETKDILRLYEICIFLCESSDDSIAELLQQVPLHEGGLSIFCSGLFHPSEHVRKQCTKFISKARETKLGSYFVLRMNPFLTITFNRSVNGTSAVAAKASIPGEITESKKHLAGSITSLNSVASKSSYLSHKQDELDDNLLNAETISFSTLSLTNQLKSSERVLSSSNLLLSTQEKALNACKSQVIDTKLKIITRQDDVRALSSSSPSLNVSKSKNIQAIDELPSLARENSVSSESLKKKRSSKMMELTQMIKGAISSKESPLFTFITSTPHSSNVGSKTQTFSSLQAHDSGSAKEISLENKISSKDLFGTIKGSKLKLDSSLSRSGSKSLISSVQDLFWSQPSGSELSEGTDKSQMDKAT